MSVSFCICVLLTTFVVGGVQCRHSEEPSCSVFDYNEKMLSKLVRMEHEMELNQKRLETWEEKIERRMSELDDAEKTRANDANELCVKVLNDFAKETDKLDQAMTSFQRQQGRISEDFVNQEVTLNTTLENYLAELRKEETKATVQICTYSGSWMRAYIVADDKVIGTVSYYEDSKSFTCTSGNGNGGVDCWRRRLG